MEMSEIQQAALRGFAGLAALTGLIILNTHESWKVSPGCMEVVKDQKDTVRICTAIVTAGSGRGMDGLCGDFSEVSQPCLVLVAG